MSGANSDLATMDLLKAMGFTVEVFPCAEDFLASELRHNTSCLISDMRMPGMSGLELHNRLVEAGAPIPTILMTAFPNGERIAGRCRWLSE